MRNKTQQGVAWLVVATAGWLTACGLDLNALLQRPPPAGEVEAYVRTQTPGTVDLQDFSVTAAEQTNGQWVVQFQTVLTPRAELYELVDVDALLRQQGWEPPPNQPVVFLTPLVRVAQRPGETFPVAGQIVANNKAPWQFRDLAWTEGMRPFGQPPQAVEGQTILWDTPEAGRLIRQRVRQGQFTSQSSVYVDAHLGGCPSCIELVPFIDPPSHRRCHAEGTEIRRASNAKLHIQTNRRIARHIEDNPTFWGRRSQPEKMVVAAVGSGPVLGLDPHGERGLLCSEIAWHGIVAGFAFLDQQARFAETLGGAQLQTSLK